MADLLPILQALGSNDPTQRGPAEQTVNDACRSNLPGYLLALLGHIKDGNMPQETRQLALVLLKNSVALDVKDVERKSALTAAWQGVPGDVRAQVKSELLNTLASEFQPVRYTAALAIANLARMELPYNEWPDLLNILINVCNSNEDSHIEASLTTIGYICEESNNSDELRGVLQHYSSQLLDVICKGMARPTPSVQYFAANALVNSLEFVHGNMAVDAQRDYLMNAVCQTCTGAPEPRIREKAMECLAKIAYLYYEYLGNYIAAIAQLTSNAISNDEPEVGLQALQFWSTVCNTEKEIKDEDIEGTCLGFSEQAMSMLSDILTQCLLKQEDGQTEEDWNLSTAASKCLVALAESVGNPIVHLIMPFVHKTIQGQTWREKEAGLMAFGCILGGPEPEEIQDTVAQAVPGLLTYMNDNNPQVSDTAAWVVGVVCEQFLDVFIQTPETLISLLNAVGPLFSGPQEKALRGAQIIHNMSLQFEDEDDDDLDSNELSPHYSQLISLLLSNIDRPEGGRLRMEGQEALNALIGAAARNCFPVLETLIPEIIKRINDTGNLIQQQAISQAEGQTYLGSMCGALSNIVRKIGPLTKKHHPQIMQAITAILNSSTAGTQFEALQTVGAVAPAIGNEFNQYVPAVMSSIIAALNALQEEELCIGAIGTVSDIASGMKEQFAQTPYCDQVMTIFTSHLRNPEVTRDIQTTVVGCTGDIALNIGPQFAKYLNVVLEILGSMDSEAQQLDLSDPDDEDFVTGLYESICHAFTGMFQGFKENLGPMQNVVQPAMAFACRTAEKFYKYDDLFRACLSLMGDIANVLCVEPINVINQMKSIFDSKCNQCIQEGKKKKSKATKEAAKFAEDEIQYLLSMH